MKQDKNEEIITGIKVVDQMAKAKQILDEIVIPREILFQKKTENLNKAAPELHSIVKKIYSLSKEPWNSIVISEDLYNRMTEVLKKIKTQTLQ